MRTTFILFSILLFSNLFGQAPEIEGDLLLCPDGEGSAQIIGNETYDSYQWYFKYWFLEDDFMPIEGATEPSFTYDWYTYDQALLKVVVTVDGNTYESNSIQIDSYAWASLFLMYNEGENVEFDPNTETYLICEGTTFDISVNSPYEVVTWYKDGVAIEEAENQTTLSITEAGSYYAVAAPSYCPNSTSTTIPINVVMTTCGEVPVIEGDLLLCPEGEGTAFVTGSTTYDSYQWYYKYWFLEDEYVAIDGATSSSFTYDWYTYDQALLKVVVTLDGITYESNEIQIDSYAWASLFVSYDLGENVEFDPTTETFSLCEGTTFDISVNSPYEIITWYKDGIVVEEAENQTTLSITEAGVYYAEAAPAFCPESKSTTMPMNVVLTDCELNTIENDETSEITIYPNPVKKNLNISGKVAFPINYSITDVSGRWMDHGTLTKNHSSISMEGLESGVYFIKLMMNNNNTTIHKVIKK